jgi:nitrite reductase (NADH) small subunit
MHNWVISLDSGSAMGADEGRVKTYGVRVEQGRIFIDGTALGARDVA